MAKKSLEERIERLEAAHQIQNLMSRYAYLHTAGRHDEIVALYAQKTPGVRIDLLDWGVYEGTEGIRRLARVYKFLERERIGELHMRTFTTTVIEVAGDGKTAKGLWIAPGLETVPLGGGKGQAFWAWVKFAVDFVKEDGEWKFWHVNVYGIFMTPYEKSWAETTPAPTPSMQQDELKPDRPSTHRWAYSPTGKQELVPAPPEPYETFDEKTAY